MSWTIRHLEAENVILVATSGPQDVAMARQMAKEAGELAIRTGVTRFLKDDRQSDLKLNTLDIYEMPKILFGLGIPRNCRIAVLINDVPEQARDFEFFTTCMFNEGSPEVKLFRGTVEEAMAWLVGPIPNPPPASG